MTRQFVVHGETMVLIKGGEHLPAFDEDNSRLYELGMCSEEIRIIPRFNHTNISVDDYGPEAAAEVQWMMGYCDIRMTLVHYDPVILDWCVQEAMGGGNREYSLSLDDEYTSNGTVGAAGTLLGGGMPLYSEGNHLLSVGLNSIGALGKEYRPWTFLSCYLTTDPMEIPVGTKRSEVQLNWRAFAYAPLITLNPEDEDEEVINEITSSEKRIWIREYLT